MGLPTQEAVNINNFPYKVVFLTGVDGSGKTFLAKRLIEALEAKGAPATHVWSRFNNFLSKPLLAYARLVGINYYEYENGVKVGYHDFENTTITSSLFVILQLCDVWIASVFKFWIPVLRKKVIIVSDRGPHDTLIDVALDTGRKDLPKSFLGRLYLKAIPFRQARFFVFRERSKIELARPDVTRDRKFQKRLELYLDNEKELGFVRVDNNGTAEEALSFIFDHLVYEEEKHP